MGTVSRSSVRYERGTAQGRLRTHSQTAKDLSILLVCRKRDHHEPQSAAEFQPAVAPPHWLSSIREQSAFPPQIPTNASNFHSYSLASFLSYVRCTGTGYALGGIAVRALRRAPFDGITIERPSGRGPIGRQLVKNPIQQNPVSRRHPAG